MRPAYNRCSKSTRLEVTKNDPPDILVRTPNHPERPLQVLVAQSLFRLSRLQASPEFKGIKTWLLVVPALEDGFKPALNSKGLRLYAPLRSFCARLQASPEFKGIKTSTSSRISPKISASSQP